MTRPPGRLPAWPDHPVLHEIFTWVWLRGLGDRLGRPVTLGTVPPEVWDEVARPGIDAVWLMGVWERSPRGAGIARANPAMRAAHRHALPDFTDADVVGSAYCVRRYVTDPWLGGEPGLAAARAALAERGVRLVLDLVPNHVAPDHPWVEQHPEYFVHGTLDELAAEPHSYLRVGEHVIACGKDPYFPAWPEVLQLDTSRRDLRAAMADEVLAIADRCDGVRCDMAMLVLDNVFARTWGERAAGGPSPDGGRGYWPTVMAPTRAAHPDVRFLAEAYWDLEPVLLDQGFDACYDKRLYDRLVHGAPPHEVRAHLAADLAYQRRTVRFVENHDEPRAASALDGEAHRTALTAVLTVPGTALVHEGEADGRRVRVPVTLGRRPVEEPDADLARFVSRLLDAVASGMRRGEWALAAVEGWADNTSAERLAAWTWTSPQERVLVVVNLGGGRADGRVRLPWFDAGTDGASAARTGEVTLVDVLSGVEYGHDSAALRDDGLYVALDDHGRHLLRLRTPRRRRAATAPRSWAGGARCG